MADQDHSDENARSRAPRSSSRPSSGGARSHSGGTKPYQKRDGDRKPYAARDGERRSYPPKRDGERKPYEKRDGDRKSYQKRDGERKPYEKRDGDRKPYQKRDGDRGRPTRGGAGRPDRAVGPGVQRAERPRHDDPLIPDDITGRDLHPSARNELKTLSKENAEEVARHLAMAAQLIDDDAPLAHRHALAAARRAGRIAVVRETVAITAYATGDFALALRELRTYRRISGRDDQIALMVDSERGVGRPDRALEVGRSVDRAGLPTPVRVELAIAMSGARLDLGQPERALSELDIPELDPDRAFEWSPALFAARATVLEELGQTAEAQVWRRRADVAADALDDASGLGDLETIEIDEIDEIDDEPQSVTQPHAAGEPEAEAATEPIESAADDTPPSVEDEVAEILHDAGIDDAADDE